MTGISANISNYVAVAVCLWIIISSTIPDKRKRFITPTIANPKCNYCDKYLVTSELYCESCKAFSPSGIKSSKEI